MSVFEFGRRSFLTRSMIFAISLISYSLFSCFGTEPASTVTSTPNSEQIVPSQTIPNVVIVVIDTLRADSLGCYGSDRGLTPRMDALAAQGTRFDRAFSTSSWTVPSVASLVTGLHPLEHGVEQGGVKAHKAVRQPALDDSLVTLAEAMRDAGYVTAGVMTNPHLTEPLGFAQGFEHFVSLGWARADKVFSSVEKIMAEIDNERPFFFWVHLFDPHHPYRPQDPHFLSLVPTTWSVEQEGQNPRDLAREFAGSTMSQLESRQDLQAKGAHLPILRAAYESEVAHIDAALQQILNVIGVTDETLVVVTSDHGEEFREHLRLGHRNSLYSELVRVPFIVSWPSRLPQGQVVKLPVSLIDLYPTVLEMVGVPEQPGISGKNRYHAGALSAGDDAVFSTVLTGDRRLSSVARGAWRLIFDERGRRVELFHEEDDPRDFHNRARFEPQKTRELRAVLVNGLKGFTPRVVAPQVPLMDETAEQLRRLGYLTD